MDQIAQHGSGDAKDEEKNEKRQQIHKIVSPVTRTILARGRMR